MKILGAAEELRIQLLGGFLVSVGNRSIQDADWRLRKARNLIKLLALASGHRLHREHLMETLWPEQDPDAAANNLHKAVYVARRAIEPCLSAATASRFLQVVDDSLILGSAGLLCVDVDSFELAAVQARRAGDPGAYEDAIRLYLGDLLPEDPFEDWAATRREQLRGLYLALLAELATLQEARDDLPGAIESLRRLVASDPSNEEAHLALMRLHAVTGHRHQALRQFQQLRTALRRDFDVDPSPESQQFYQNLLTARVAAIPPVGAPRPAQSRSNAENPQANLENSTPLVGRGAEIEAIEKVIDSVFAGQGRLVLLEGEAGIGKSRLMIEIVRRVRQRGGTALQGAAYEQEGQLPYGPFVEALEPVGATVEISGLRALFGDAATDLARLPAPEHTVLRAERQRLFASVAEQLRLVATRSPVVLALDDLHAADEASLQLLHYVARTTREHAVFLLGTFRPEEAPMTSTLRQLVGTLRREQLLVCLNLERLGSRECDRLVEVLLADAQADDAVLEAIHRIAAGNPLYIEEVVRSLRESGRLQSVAGRWQLSGEDVPLPGPVLDLLAGRLERLGTASMQLLSLVAVVGSEASYPLLRAACELPESAILDALDACLAHGALKEMPHGYRFNHPLQRAAIYERLSRARRTVIHGRVAAALEQLYADQREDHAESLAHHWSLSDQPGRAVSYLIRAGDRAMTVYANEAAVAAFRQAVDLLGSPGAPDQRASIAADVWEKIGDLWALAGHVVRDEEAYRAAIGILEAESTLAPDRFARLHRKAAYGALARHDADVSARHLASAEAILKHATDSVELGRVRLVRALWSWQQGGQTEGRSLAEESLALARQQGDELDLINAYMTLALVFHSSGEWKEGLHFEIEHVGAASNTDPGVGLLFDAHACLGEYHLYGDRSFDAVEAHARQTLDLATRMGAPRAQALAWLLLGESLLLRGLWNDADDCLERSLDLQSIVGSAIGQGLTLQRLAELCIYRGDHDAAEARLRQAFEVNLPPLMAPHVTGRLYATAASNALERGDPDMAGRMLAEAAEVAMQTGECATCTALLHPVATQTYVALGDLERAEEHAEAARKVATLWESGGWHAMAEMSQAAVLRARADYRSSIERYLAAAAAFERLGQPFEAARCLFFAGQTQADAGNSAEARDLVTRALTTFMNLGAAAASRQARQQLARL